ncbi:MAG: AraC family transcriptional regulator [Kiritimatiellia bacterium]
MAPPSTNHPDLRRDGFPGERHLLVPADVVQALEAASPPAGIWVSAAGHFPQASGHLVTRPRGDPAHILLFCVQGGGWCRFAGKLWRLKAGQAVVVPRGAAHAYGSTKLQPWSIYWAHFQGPQADAWLKSLGLRARDPLLTCGQPGVVSYHFEELLDLLRNGFSPANLLALSASLALVLSLLNLHRVTRRADAQGSLETVRSTVEFMRQNLSRRLGVADLARVAGLSPPHYTVVFRRLFGFPPLAFFLRMKVQEACRLLVNGPTPVREISDALGFEDPYYFSRFFKKITRLAPVHYREAKRLR